MNPVAYGLTMIELERQDSGIRSFCSVQSALAMYPIHAFGTEEQRERWLPGMARGELIGAFGLTEPNSGSDPGSMRTHARQLAPGGDYVLSGQKFWITNSPIADVMIVWAKTLDFGSDTPVIRGFLVERGMKGLLTPETHGKLSLRASITGEIVLDEVKVPEAQPAARRLRPQGPAQLPHPGPLRHRLGSSRRGDGRLRASPPLHPRARAVRQAAGWLPADPAEARRAAQRDRQGPAARLPLRPPQAGRPARAPCKSAYLKRDNVRMAREAAQTARTMLGGNGIMGEFHIMRHLCNLETVYTYEGTHEIHTLAIGRAITGLDAFT